MKRRRKVEWLDLSLEQRQEFIRLARLRAMWGFGPMTEAPLGEAPHLGWQWIRDVGFYPRRTRFLPRRPPAIG